MTTASTTLLGLALPVTGELSGTWGDTVNNSITNLLDSAVAGTTTLSTDGDVILTTTDLAANQARQAILLCSGARTAARNITAPARSKIYTVINATTGGYAVVIRGSGPTTGVTVPAGQTATVAWNGSDFVDASNYFGGNLKVNGNLSVTGNTTLTGAFTANGNVTLGDATADTVTVNSTIASNLIFTDNTYDIGASGATRPRNLYLAGNQVIGGSSTLSAGAANGVAYLNGSKVLTTGSGIVFDGTNFGVGTASPATRIHAVSTYLYQTLRAELTGDPNGVSAAAITVGSNTNGGLQSGSGYGLQIYDKSSNSGGGQSGYGLYVTSPYDGSHSSGGYYALAKYGVYVDDLYSYYGVNSTAGSTNYGIYIKGGGYNYLAASTGIGITTPAGKIHAVGSPTAYFDKNADSAQPQIRMRSTHDSYAREWAIGQAASSNDVSFGYFNGTSWNGSVASFNSDVTYPALYLYGGYPYNAGNSVLAGTFTTDGSGNATINLTSWGWGDFASYRRAMLVTFAAWNNSINGIMSWIGWLASGDYGSNLSAQSGVGSSTTLYTAPYFSTNSGVGGRYLILKGQANTTYTYDLKGLSTSVSTASYGC